MPPLVHDQAIFSAMGDCIVGQGGGQETMDPRGWQRVLQKYTASIGSGMEVVVILKSAPDHLQGVIKEMDTDFLVLETKSGHIAAVIALSEVAALQTYQGQW
jgi:hypothetical protein